MKPDVKMLARLLGEANRPPWVLKEGEPGLVWILADNGEPYCTVASTRPGGAANAELIAAAVNNLGPLLARLAACEKVVAKVAEMPEWPVRTRQVNEGGDDGDRFVEVSEFGDCAFCGAEPDKHAHDCAWLLAVELRREGGE